MTTTKSDLLDAEDARRISESIFALVGSARELVGLASEAPPRPGSRAAAQFTDRANLVNGSTGDSAVAGVHDAIARVTIAALEHADAFAELTLRRRTFSAGVLARASVEALGIAWHQLSAPDVRTMIERNINVRLNELYFPAKHGARLEDGGGGAVPAAQVQKELRELRRSQGFTASRIQMSDLAADVIDRAMGGGGASHYSQLSTMAHASLPMISIHMDSLGMHDSRAMHITAAVDMVSPLVFVVGQIRELFEIRSSTWAETALHAIDVLTDLNGCL